MSFFLEGSRRRSFFFGKVPVSSVFFLGRGGK